MNEIKLFGIVGRDVSQQSIESQLAQADREQMLTVRIHSEGGRVFDGLGIYEAFRSYDGPKRAVVESLAASIASYIATAFDQVEIAENGFFMLHEPFSMTTGDSVEHAKMAELLAKLKTSMLNAYSAKMGVDQNEVAAIMAAETWFDSQEAVKAGLADSIVKATVAPMALSNTLPQRVYASIAGARVDGDTRDMTKETDMSDANKPVVATIDDIETLLPKADAEFVLNCVKKGMTLNQVSEEALKDLSEKNESLGAELAEAKSKIEELEAKPAPEPEHQPQNKAGQKPIGTTGDGVPKASSRQEWETKIGEKLSRGVPRAKAVSMVNRENPGLRADMLAEVNA